ncbi:MAG: formate/nitrite transporter family protein [Gammaproteobacteria bacterium]|nr:formate/nitrite transporter family protein [Gammaproteobacteria bacterium]
MNTPSNRFNALIPQAMADKAEEVGVVKATKDPLQSFYLAITAGVFISIAFVFYTTVTIGADSLPFGLAKLIGGIAFSVGLILVVICGGELFTTPQLLQNWIVVYLGNITGGGFIVGMTYWTIHRRAANT